MSKPTKANLMPPSLQEVRDQHGPVQNVNELHEQKLTLSDRIALWTVNIVGTMGFFYFCVILVTVPLFWAASMPVIQYISSGYLQLIFLPLIMVGQNLLGRHGELRAENDFQINLKAEREIEVLYKHLEYQNAILIAMMKKLDVRLEDVEAITEETSATLESIAEKMPSRLNAA